MKSITSKSNWEKLLTQFPDASFLQSWNWGQTHANLGKKVLRFSLKSGGCAQFIKESAKRATYLTCPGGPQIPYEKHSLTEFVTLCKELCRQEKATFVRIRPQCLDTSTNRKLFHLAGFVNAPMHMNAEHTARLDLALSDSQLLSRMRKTTRYLIKKAQNMGVVVKASTSPESVDNLYDLQLSTSLRHRFIPFPKDFLKSHFQEFIVDNQIVILEGYWQKQLVSSAMIVFYNHEAVYHYSGSSSNFSHIPVNYLLQWEAIQQSRRRKMRYYNFWGVAPDDRQNHRFSGVTTFKMGFGPDRLSYLPAQDFPASPLYWPTFLFETVRRITRNL